MTLLTIGKVVHGGTYNSQFLSMIATVKTLENYSRNNFHKELDEKTIFLKEGLEKIFYDEKILITNNQCFVYFKYCPS